MKKIILAFILCFMVLTAGARNIMGDWSGRLPVSPQMSLKLVMHIGNDGSVALDSPDQGAYGIEGTMVFLSPDSVNVAVPKLGMTYAGHLENGEIRGIFRQRAMSIPLTLTPGEHKACRPQTPVPPFPYNTEEITVEYDDITLAGTLTIPENTTNATPVVVMVSGSGLQNRDEEFFEHKPFAVIADYLARNGIASFRYDDRGVGGSKGDVVDATTADFASDARAVAEYLRATERFGGVGIVGHSEGGLIAFMLGAEPCVDFAVAIAGPSIKGTKTIAYQNKVALVNADVAAEMANDFEAAVERALEYKISHPDGVEVSDELIEEFYPQCGDDETTERLAASLETVVDPDLTNPWMMYFLACDPAEYLRTLKVPVFIAYGTKDCQVPSELNAPIVRANAPSATLKVYEGLNHLMQHATTGAVEEYSTIEETISPEVIADIVAFIKDATKK